MIHFTTLAILFLELLTTLLGWNAIMDSAQQCRYRQITMPGLLETSDEYKYLLLLVPIFGLVVSAYSALNRTVTKETVILVNQARISVLLLVFISAVAIAMLPLVKLYAMLGQ